MEETIMLEKLETRPGERPDRTHRRVSRRATMVTRWLWTTGLALLLWAGPAQAQPPLMFVDDASVFEGQGGTTILRLPVRFVGTQSTTVTGVVSAIAMTGTGFNSPIGGSSCTGGVDFIPFTGVPFSIPPNTPNGTLSVNITVCGNTAIELDEHIFVELSGVVGADCSLEGPCTAIGTIVNDDGPPGIRINDISITTVAGVRKTAVFTVSLHHPTSSEVSVNFLTRDGTARASTTTRTGSYLARSGRLTIPANTLSATISVTATGFGGGTFFMDLSNPVNGTIVDGTGRANISIITLTIGTFDIDPDAARVSVGDRVDYAVTWTVPSDLVWRSLETLHIRLRRGNHSAIWVRWDEVGDTFRLCESTGARGQGHADDQVVTCGPGFTAGSPEVLETPEVRLYLADTRVVGSGPTGQSVTLHLSLEFLGAAAHLYHVELAATDDLGRSDDFEEATTVLVLPVKKP
jgi:hypothetical protein